MRGQKHPARRYVVCIRVSDQEKLALEELTQGGSRTISNLMRESLDHYLRLWQNRLPRK